MIYQAEYVKKIFCKPSICPISSRKWDERKRRFANISKFQIKMVSKTLKEGGRSYFTKFKLKIQILWKFTFLQERAVALAL